MLRNMSSFVMYILDPNYGSDQNGLLGVLNYYFYGNQIRTWFFAVAALFVILMILYFMKKIIYKKLTEISATTETVIDDHVAGMLGKTKFIFLFAVAFYFSTKFLVLPQTVSSFISKLVILIFWLQVAIWVNRIIALFLDRYQQVKLQEDNASARASISAISFISKMILWAVILILILDNLGFDIKTLVAGLGIGGIAVALAMQNILGDIFASFLIVLDKPFVIGDFIIIDGFMGTVEYIGLKTTRLRSLSGEQLVFANSDLIKSRVRNYKRMEERRIVFGFGVTYQTSSDKLEAIPDLIKTIIDEIELTRFDRAHFQKYGASSLDFEVVYIVLSADYNQYMDVQQIINLKIFKVFEEQGIEFAYPTQTLFVNSEAKSKNNG